MVVLGLSYARAQKTKKYFFNSMVLHATHCMSLTNLILPVSWHFSMISLSLEELCREIHTSAVIVSLATSLSYGLHAWKFYGT